MDSIKKLAEKRLSIKPTKRARDALTAYIANNPGVQYEDLVRKSLELGYEPSKLIDETLGSVIVDKEGLNLQKPLVDLLNETYESNRVPGYRYVVDPNDVKSATGKEIAKALEGSHGISSGWRWEGASRGHPDFVAVEDAKDEIGKMVGLVSGGHEIKHTENRMIRPNFKSTGMAGEIGHHYGSGTFEAEDLVKRVRDLPDDEKVTKEILKRAKGFDTPSFIKLRSLAPMLAKGAAVGAGGLASLAAEAADSSEEGSSSEQAALMRDIDQRNREKKILDMVPEQNKANVQQELENQRLGLRRSAIEDLLRK
jgi:hypothetical protein